jgi:hypothetical protein
MSPRELHISIVGYFLLVILGSVVFLTWKEAERVKECPCNADMAREIAAIYVMLNPVEENHNYPMVISQLQESYPDLNNKSDLIRCMRMIGKRYLYAGIQPFIDDESARTQIYKIGLECEISQEIFERTYYDLIYRSVDMYNFGKELLWLASVLPTAVRGDSTRYYYTGTITRNMIRDWITSTDEFIMDDPLTSSSMYDVFREYRAECYSLAEEQAVIYCMLAGY